MAQVKVSEAKHEQVDRLKQEQDRLEELLFLVDQQRRPRLQKVLSGLRAEIVALEAPAQKLAVQPAVPESSLPELRQRQSDLEETLFREPPERRAPVKRLLAQVREAIAA